MGIANRGKMGVLQRLYFGCDGFGRIFGGNGNVGLEQDASVVVYAIYQVNGDSRFGYPALFYGAVYVHAVHTFSAECGQE